VVGFVVLADVFIVAVMEVDDVGVWLWFCSAVVIMVLFVVLLHVVGNRSHISL